MGEYDKGYYGSNIGLKDIEKIIKDDDNKINDSDVDFLNKLKADTFKVTIKKEYFNFKVFISNFNQMVSKFKCNYLSCKDKVAFVDISTEENKFYCELHNPKSERENMMYLK